MSPKTIKIHIANIVSERFGKEIILFSRQKNYTYLYIFDKNLLDVRIKIVHGTYNDILAHITPDSITEYIT